MRVALVCEHLQNDRGGAETSTVQFVQHLLGRGIEVHLLTRSVMPEGPGLHVHPIEARRAPKSLRTAAFALAASELAVGLETDLIHAVTPCLSADVYEPRGGTLGESMARNLALRPPGLRRMAKRAMNCLNIRQLSLLALERRLLMRQPAPRIIAISAYVTEQLRRYYGIGGDTVLESFNGVDPPQVDDQRRRGDRVALRSDLGVDDKTVLILLVAHNFRLKGVHRWIEAARILHQNAARSYLSIIVGKSRPDPYRRLAKRLGVAGQIRFIGPRLDMAPVYAAADVLVHPTYYDPCSRVVLEALLWSLPCVTTRFNGAAEAIEDAVTGRIVDSPDDAAALAQAVQQAAQPEYREALTQRQPRLRHELSMARHADDVIRLYSTMVSQGCTAARRRRRTAECTP